MLPKQINKQIGKALHDYSMLADGDRVLVAVSGGIDSLVLAWVLANWQKKAPISYTLYPAYVDMDGQSTPEQPDSAAQISTELAKVGLPLHVEKGIASGEEQRDCFSCSKLRRKQLFDLASRCKCNKIAFGHHKDDLVETLFINMLYSGNISTMVPAQRLFGGKLMVIRPLAYVDKHAVESIGENLGIVPVKNRCPLAGDTRREKMQQILASIYEQVPGAKASLFASMKNVREGYML